MRILVNTDTFEPLGGVERSTLQVSAELVRRGHSCRLLHADRAAGRPGSDPTDLQAEWTRLAESITRVPGFTVAARTPWRTAHQLPAAVRAAAKARPDVIYLNRSEQLPWALAGRRATDAGLVVHLRHHPFAAPLVRLLGGRPVGAPRVRFVAVSDYLRDRWLAAGLNPDVTRTVPNGVDPAAYPVPTPLARRAARAAVGVHDDRPLVLCYGRLSADKGVGTLLDAWPRVAAAAGTAGIHTGADSDADTNRTGPATLLLAGDPTPEIRARLDELTGARDRNVRWLPRRDDVLGLLHAADLVVLPARWAEPFGRVVIETMSTGVPVIASRVGGIPEILTGPFADLLVGPGDPDALARAIVERLAWRTRTPRLGDAARDHVRRRFTLDRTVDAVESALTEVATRSSTPAEAFA